MIFPLASDRSRNRAPKSSRRPSVRSRQPRVARLGVLEQFEDRVLLSAGVGLIAASQLNTGATNYPGSYSVAPAVGFVAQNPTLSADGTTINFTFDNSAGTGPITIGLATYLDQSVTLPVPLASQVLEGTQAITLAKGQGPTTVKIPVEPCIQVDAFIESTTYTPAGSKTPVTVGSQPIAKFSPLLDTSAFIADTAPAVDAGYNTTGFVPTTTNPSPPPGTLGTLVAYVLTDDAGGPACPTSTFSGTVATNCNGTSMPLAGQGVTLSGTGPTGSFTLNTVTVAGGGYSFSIPYGDLPASNVTVSVPVSSPAYFPGSASVGTISSLGGLQPSSPGTVAISSTSEQISGIPVGFGGMTASNDNFVLNLPNSISGTVYTDATGNGLGAGNAPQAGDTPLGGAAVTLYNTATKATTTLTSKADGTYSFGGLPAGTYTVSEADAGTMDTGPLNGSYTVTLGSCQNPTGYNFTDLMTCSGAITGVSYTDVGPKGTTTFGSLGGNTREGDVVTVNFTVSGTATVTLVSYTASVNNSSTLTSQQVFQYDTQTFTAGNHSLTVTIPDSYYQIDFVCGPAITAFNPANNDTYHGESRFFDSDNGGTESPQAISSFSSLSGYVYLDTTGNFTKDAGQAGVTVTLTGTDVNNQSLTETRVTGADGSYSFQGLQPGTYTLRETTPSGDVTTMDVVGTAGGTSAATATNPNFNSIALTAGVSGAAYDFGVNTPLGKGATATTCFWASCRGNQLIDSFNGGPCSTSFSNWLAAEFPHLAGCFAGQTNQQVAWDVDYLASCGGNQLSSELLDAALSIYATSTNLAGSSAASLAAQDGFVVTPGGSGSGLVNVGNQLAGFGGPTGYVSLLNLLLYVDSSSCQLNNWCFDYALDSLFGGVLQSGGINC